MRYFVGTPTYVIGILTMALRCGTPHSGNSSVSEPLTRNVNVSEPHSGNVNVSEPTVECCVSVCKGGLCTGCEYTNVHKVWQS